MRDKGIAHIGIGSASGENKAVDAIKEAMDSPLLETTVSGASDIIVNFSGNIGIVEAYDAVTYLTEQAGDGVNIIFGTVDNDNMGEEISITIIATGLERSSSSIPVSVAQTYVEPAHKAAETVSPAPTYNGQRLGSGITKPSFMTDTATSQAAVKPAQTTAPQTVAAKPAVTQPVRPTVQPNNDGIKIPDFLKKR